LVINLKFLIRNNTFFRKLVVSYIAVILIIVLLIAFFFSNFFYRYFINSQEEELVSRGYQLSKILSEEMTGYVNKIRIEYLINSLERLWNIKLWVTDRDGIVIAVSRGIYSEYSIQRGMRIDNEDLKAVNEGKSTVRRGYTRYLNQSAIFIGIPVNSSVSGEFIGAVFLNKPVVNIYEVNFNMLKFLLLAAILSIIPTFIICFYLSSTISKPLSQMNKTAMAMASGNYKMRVDVYGKDEIGQLGKSLNDLSCELDSTITELSQEKGKLELILTSLSEGIIAVDVNKKIIHYNNAALEILNIQINSNGLYWNTLVEHKHEWLTNIIDDVLEQKIRKEIDYKINKDLTIHAIISPIMDNSDIKDSNNKASDNLTGNTIGKAIGAVALIRDISEFEKLEQMRRDYVANISHELRTPLTAVRGFIEPLVDGTVEDRQVMERYHNIIYNETLRLQRLINDLLDLSRLQAGRVQIDLEPMDIRGIIENVIVKLKIEGDKKNIKINYQNPENLSAVMGNEDRIEQLLIILMDNAISFTPEGGKVDVNVREDKNFVRIFISDTGVGISPEDLKHIWERFYKADKSRGNTKGTGLGLSIAKHIIELLGGEITAESALGKGSTFKVSLRKA